MLSSYLPAIVLTLTSTYTVTSAINSKILISQHTNFEHQPFLSGPFF